MKKLSEVLGVGKLVGSRGASFRKTSTSKPDDWKDHSGKDVGAMRNFAHEKAAVAKAAASKSERESIVNKRNKDAAQRAKETLRMAKEGLDEAKGKFVYDKPLKANVAAMDKHSTDALKGMHDRWSSDHKDMKSNPSHSERLLAAHHVLKNRGVSVPDLPQHKNLGMVRRFTTEATESSGTEARVKIKNVARPNDAAPTSEKSLLSRNGEIKVKKVDEDIAASISRKYGLTDSILEAARAVMEKRTQVDLDPTTDDKEDNGDNDDDDDVKKESKHTTPKSDKEKKLAALAHPKDKITHKDVLVGRGVLKKEEVEIDETKLSYDDFTKGARRAGSGSTDELIASLKKKRSGPGSGTVRKLDKAELKRRTTTAKNEEVKQVDEAKSLRKNVNYVGRPVAHKDGRTGVVQNSHTDGSHSIKWKGEKTPTKHDWFETKNKIRLSENFNSGAELKRRTTTAKEETEIDEKTLYGNPAELKRQLDQLAKREKALPPGISPARKTLAIQKQKLQKAHSAAMGMKKEDVDSLTEEQLEEVLKKSDPAGTWVKDFVHSKDPKFAGKSKKERMKMALGAYYGKQRNEEVEEVDEAIKPYVSYSAGGTGKSPSATVMAANEKPHKTFTKTEHGHDYKQKAMDYFKKHGNKLKEEEQLDELSPTTLKSYEKGAKKDVKHARDDIAYQNRMYKDFGARPDVRDSQKTIAKRTKGIELAKAKTNLSGRSGITRATIAAREEVEFSFTNEEIERLEAIAAQLDEAKPTIVSAPIRGANQDQSGFGVKSNTADYTISDSKKVKVKEEAELDEAIGRGSLNVTKNIKVEPNWKDPAQRQKEAMLAAVKANREAREAAAKKKTNEETELDEGRGRPKKSGGEAEGDDTAKHPIQQLHKIAAGIQGNEPHFEHKDGSKTKVSKQLAKHITAVYGSMRTTQDKEDFANKLHANRQSMMTAVDKHVR